MKDFLYEVIDKHAEETRGLSDAIWGFAETAYAETESAKVLADYLESQGFTVERGVAGIDTAFTATYGTEGLHIGFLGEYDALADLSQTSCKTTPDARCGKSGHGCGHNLLGAGAVAAAVAVKEYIAAGNPGRVTYFGCPAEEGGSGKAFMARDGVFDGLDCAITWHPGSTFSVSSGSSLANYQVIYRFHGIAAHAAGAPHLGRSALDAVELMNIGVQFLREHIPSTARIHYAITNPGGYSPNVVQAEASVLYLMRMTKVTELPDLYARVNAIAEGAALMTGTSVEHEFIKGCSNTIPNRPLIYAMHKNMKEIPLPVPTEDELAYGTELRKTIPTATEGVVYAQTVDDVPETESAGGGSTDVADVSWVCPTVYLGAATWPREVSGHTWQVTASGKSSFAIKSMIYAAKVMAATALDIYNDPELLEKAKAYYTERTGGKYECPIPAGVRPQIISDIH